jgi:hypothetical protein
VLDLSAELQAEASLPVSPQGLASQRGKDTHIKSIRIQLKRRTKPLPFSVFSVLNLEPFHFYHFPEDNYFITVWGDPVTSA